MRKSMMSTVVLAIASVGLTMVLSSCGCKIKDEQLSTIQRLRTEERQLGSDIEASDRNKTRLMGELDSRQSEVRRCNEKKAFVQDKMNKWPNIWPDYDPNAVPPAPAEPEMKNNSSKRSR